MADKPVKSFTENFVTAAVWENSNGDKTWFKVTVSRSYRDGDETKSTHSLDAEDIPSARAVLEDARRWVAAEKRRRAQAAAGAAA